MIDFHSHIIPGIDDGADSFDMSIEMLKNSVNEGTKFICATSHYIPGEDAAENFNYRNEKGVESSIYDEKLLELTKLCSERDIDINILKGMELYMSLELPELYKEKRIWGLNNSQYLLIELPMQQFPLYTEEVLYELRLLGAIPIIAHPERNFRIMKDRTLLESLVSQGTLAQVNAGSLTGSYGKDIKTFAEVLVKMNLVHMIGSDAHNDKKRTTKINGALKIIEKNNNELYNWIKENEFNIINGLSVELPQIKRKNKTSFFFGLFKKN
ncbi:tyrosine-protein phosphatase [Clostridium oryzae]|uniref:protein-tyrosine-phosphatase n=1 Tax=Clostridium oryzae TaxID=1450648 RepID=A0A1V4INN1_9CLOT|nr:CpsB/CapC family capsule biosynthesis tyrosine phosphatase [Clostridium oryzae]OPJ61658.1 tyrosine-protein phosphatase YwqE [Clostridium oryzae]